MIDIGKIKRNIISIADDIFSEGINEEGIKRFISEVINYSEEAFEESFFSREKDKTILSFMDQEAYLDFSTGYVAQMRRWQQNHAAQVKEVEFDSDELKEANDNLSNGDKEILCNSLKKLGVATVLVIGIGFIIPNTAGIIVGLFAEAIALTYVINSYYKDKKKLTDARKQKEVKLNTLKEKVLNAVINDITAWLKSGEKESDRIEQTFKKTTTDFLY